MSEEKEKASSDELKSVLRQKLKLAGIDPVEDLLETRSEQILDGSNPKEQRERPEDISELIVERAIVKRGAIMGHRSGCASQL